MEKPVAPPNAAGLRVLPNAQVAPLPNRFSYWQGLLWSEWHAHSKLLLVFLIAWLLMVWILPLFTNPGWILAFGLVYALIAGPVVGGSDVIDGCEEFVLALPPTRSERYLARLAISGGALLFFTLLDLLVLGLDLAQAIVRLYLDTGLIHPVEILKPRLLYGLVLAFPFAVFATGFSLAANARGRALAVTGWFWAGLVALIILKLGLFYEYWSWKVWTGLIACTGLGVAGCVALWTGYRLYRRKEIVPASKPFTMPSFWWLWLFLAISGLALTLFLVTSLWQELKKMMGQ